MKNNSGEWAMGLGRQWATGLMLRIALVIGLLWLTIPVSAAAITTLSQGYVSTDNLSLGSIVSLKANSTDHISATTPQNVNNILGVVIDAGAHCFHFQTVKIIRYKSLPAALFPFLFRA